eukprot:scaffold25_cov342-Pavlova_lutheri.AAC.5
MAYLVPSHTGAAGIPCSYSAWKACRTGRLASRSTTLPLSGMSSYAVCVCRNSKTLCLVVSISSAKPRGCKIPEVCSEPCNDTP